MREGMEFSALRGTWVSGNTFIDEDGIEHFVVAFPQTLEEYYKCFPLKCFMLIQGTTVRQVVEDE